MLWLLTIGPGLLLGRLVTQGLSSAISSDLSPSASRPTATSYTVTAAGTLATMILAAQPAIRRINRADLAQATKALV